MTNVGQLENLQVENGCSDRRSATMGQELASNYGLSHGIVRQEQLELNSAQTDACNRIQSMMKLFELQDDVLSLILDYISSPSNMQELEPVAAVSKFFSNVVNKRKECYVRYINGKHRLLKFDSIAFEGRNMMAISRVNTPKLILIGGTQDYRRCDVFHPYKNKFSKCCSVDIKRSDEFDAVFHGGLVFAVSGSEPASIGSVECYNVIKNQWVSQQPLPKPLVSMSLTVLHDQLYVLGGYDRKMNRRSCSIFMLNPATDIYDVRRRPRLSSSGSFEDDDKYPSPPSSLKVSVKHSAEDHPPTPCMRELKPREEECENQCWIEYPDISLISRRSHHASVGYRNRIWIAGGLLEGHSYVTNSVEIFDPTSRTCIAGPSMVNPRTGLRLMVVNDELYAVGGDMVGTVHGETSIEKYDDKLEQWRIASYFPIRRPKSCSAANGNSIFVFGGASGGKILTSWDSFNVVTRQWATQCQAEGLDTNTGRSVSSASDFNSIPGRQSGIKSAIAVSLSF